ncbi:MAG: hypothetical protein JXR80_06035 [Deltaproteobacteria bacterium]|nr:hypothetical protein [Deltaproteobacteria bacterium]
MKIYADRLYVYKQDKLVACHQRSYERHQDFENSNHPKELLAEHRKAHDQQILRRFLSISAKSQSYYQKLEVVVGGVGLGKSHLATVVGLPSLPETLKMRGCRKMRLTPG